MIRKSIFLFYLFISEFTIAFGQVNSDVFYYDFSKSDDKAINLTSNREGYNNQPIFFSDYQILMSSNMDKKFNDIFILDLNTGEAINITNTDSLSEFSPTLSKDKKYIYCVRQENDGKNTQSMWRYKIEDNHILDKGERVFSEFGNIGYFCFWGKNMKKCAMFVVTQPLSLQIVEPDKKSSKNFPYVIGRALKVNSKGDLYFTKLINEKYELWKMNGKSSKESKVIDITSQDFTIFDNKIYTTDSTQILVLNKKKWEVLLEIKGLKKLPITRLDINKTNLVFVTSK